MNKEYRNISGIKTDENSRRIEGYAIRFNEQSADLGFFETIEPSAISEEFLRQQDVIALFDHNRERGILARYNKGVGNLNLELRKDGLFYSFDALPTALGDEVLAYIRSGIIGGSSFAFAVDDDGDRWERRNDGKLYRTITKIAWLGDVSCVINPAYPTSTCSCRSLDKFLEEEQKSKELKEKYNKLRDEINNY